MPNYFLYVILLAKNFLHAKLFAKRDFVWQSIFVCSLFLPFNFLLAKLYEK